MDGKTEAGRGLDDAEGHGRAVHVVVHPGHVAGRLEIVDIGKPDGTFQRRLMGLYIVLMMPIIAKFFIRGRMTRNPFQMIVPTFQRLAKNRSVTRMAEGEFGSARLHKFLLGGLVIIEADRMA